MNSNTTIFLLAVLAVAILVYIAILLSSKRKPVFDKENYQVDFLRIENSLKKDNEPTYALAIINGDKLLDKALCELGLPGRTMGDRLKKLNRDRISCLNAVWSAHKIRNQIAHEADYQPSYAQAQNALKTYRQALMELGAI